MVIYGTISNKRPGQKGPNLLELLEVKGHITQDRVDAQVRRACDKYGNDKADHAADVAVRMHGDTVARLASIFHNRHAHET